jgi:hypothetical protein
MKSLQNYGYCDTFLCHESIENINPYVGAVKWMRQATEMRSAVGSRIPPSNVSFLLEPCAGQSERGWTLMS